MQKKDLAAVISSRICHDLVSPVGAIVNGIDLMREIGTGDVQDELGMIGQSAERAAGLLQFYRVAFGSVGEEAAPIARATLRDQTVRLIETPRIGVEWTGSDGPPLQRAEARLLFLLVLCGKALLGRRGTVGVSLGVAATWPMAVSIDTEPGMPLSGVEDDLALLQGDGTPSARQVEFALARDAASEMGLGLAARHSDAQIMISVV